MILTSPLAGEVASGSERVRGICQRVRELCGDTFRILQHAAIPETKNVEALCFKPFRSPSIGLFCVLAAIDLNDESILEAHKVNEVAAYRLLTAKFAVCEGAIAQDAPEPLPSKGRIAA